MNRRNLLKAASVATAFPFPFVARASGTRPRILLRSSWQTVNIGDVAHTPGMLRLLERDLPECDVTLWPNSVGDGVREILLARFPRLAILEPSRAAEAEAVRTHDFFLHGSGPGLTGAKSLAEWRLTGKPHGVGGITWSYSAEQMKLIDSARFAFFRDSVSLGVARDRGSTCPILEFGPDATFACDLVDDAAAAWLAGNGLEEGRFVCCVPRLRYTPYWEIKKGVAFDPRKHEVNERMKEHDIGPLRETVIAVARRTPMKVLLCPEDASQMKLNREMILDRLPDDVKPRVVWREDYWLTGFARSVHGRGAGLFGNEQHSPILCIGQGVPAVVCRFREQTSKGFMWRDIGLDDWLLDHDLDEPARRLTDTVLAIIADPAAARAKALAAREVAQARMKRMTDALRAELGI